MNAKPIKYQTCVYMYDSLPVYICIYVFVNWTN